MRPVHEHGSVGNLSQAKLFANDVCLRAASSLAGMDYLKYPFDLVARSQAFILDAYEGDRTSVGFSATKMYGDYGKPFTSVNYNIWVHSSLYFNSNMLEALDKEQADMIAAYLEAHPDAEIIKTTNMGLDDDVNDIVITDHIEFYINSKQRKPVKQRFYRFTHDGDRIMDIIYAQPFPMSWLGDNPSEQLLLTKLADEYLSTFDSLDIRTMLGVLGRIGLFDVS